MAFSLLLLLPFFFLFLSTIVPVQSAVGPNSDGTCPLLALLPFTDRDRDSQQRSVQVPFSHMASFLLAIDHFNARNPVVVKELASDETYASCNVQFPTSVGNNSSSVVADTKDGGAGAVEAILQARDAGFAACGIVGPYRSAVALSASVVSAAMNVPLVSHGAKTYRIGRQQFNPLTTRTMVDDYAMADAVMSYLHHRGRDYVTVLHVTFQDDILKYFDRAAKRYNMSVRGQRIALPFTGKEEFSIYDAMRRIQESGFRTVYVAVARKFMLDLIIEMAEQFGMNQGYVWIISDVTDVEQLTFTTSTPPGSPTDKFLRGMAAVRVLDGFSWNESDSFLSSWRSVNSSFVRRVNELNPIQVGRPGHFRATNEYFRDAENIPARHSSFMYDAVMAVGMGACRAALNETQSSQPKDPHGPPPLRNAHFNGIITTRFHGASGHVLLGDEYWELTRDPESVVYGVYNVRPIDGVNVTYEYVLTAVKYPLQSWTEVEGQEFIFSDGTTNEPVPFRDVDENNYLPSGAHIFGLTMMSVSILFSVVAAGWTFVKRNINLIKAAQPAFLYLICFGTIIAALAIFTSSFDESYGWEEESLSAACMATTWLFVLGYIVVFSSLFSKLWRIDRVLQFSRRKVAYHQVLWPFAFLLLSAVIVLAVWTGVDPSTWQRETINEDTGETYGKCEYSVAFLVPLVVLMVLAMILTAVMAWKSRDISSKFSEADWIFYAIFIQIQVWAVGLPTLIVLYDTSVVAAYIGRVMLIWTFTVSMVLLIFGPKMFGSCGLTYRRESQMRGNVGSGRVRVTGHGPSSNFSTLPTPPISSVGTDQRSDSAPLSLPTRKSGLSTAKPSTSAPFSLTPAETPEETLGCSTDETSKRSS